MKDIAGYEGLYAVTSCGKVWSYKKQSFLSQGKHNGGYLVVALSKNGMRKMYYVHRLVACAFIENPQKFAQVNHKNENKTDNYINNLEWCDSKYNNNYGTHIERSTKKQMKKVICAETKMVFSSIREVEDTLGICGVSVCSACKFKIRETHGLHFYYLDYYTDHYEELKKTIKKRYVYCVEKNKYYETCVDAANDIGGRQERINRACNGKIDKAYGMTYQYVEKEVIP